MQRLDEHPGQQGKKPMHRRTDAVTRRVPLIERKEADAPMNDSEERKPMHR
jgi:hypothetical protein